MALWTSGITGVSRLSVLFSASHSKVVVALLLGSPGLGVCDGAPQLEDEVVGEAERLQVGVVHGLRQLHGVGLALCELPDLRRCKNIGSRTSDTSTWSYPARHR